MDLLDFYQGEFKDWLDILIKDSVIKKFVDANAITSFSKLLDLLVTCIDLLIIFQMLM